MVHKSYFDLYIKIPVSKTRYSAQGSAPTFEVLCETLEFAGRETEVSEVAILISLLSSYL